MYDSMEPVVQKRFQEDIKRKYSTMDATKKKEVLSQRSEKLVKPDRLNCVLNSLRGNERRPLFYMYYL